ncbi:glutathione-dependent formaldehyde dehydrogenase, partial [Escherichia coli]
LDTDGSDAIPDKVREHTGGRGPDSVIDAVGLEAHGNPIAEAAMKGLALLPKRVQGAVMTNAGIDRLDALMTAIESVRRGGTISI